MPMRSMIGQIYTYNDNNFAIRNILIQSMSNIGDLVICFQSTSILSKNKIHLNEMVQHDVNQSSILVTTNLYVLKSIGPR